MPIYEYHCRQCEQTVEVLVRGAGVGLQCPNCGTPLSERRISASHHRMSVGHSAGGATCCGREERCDKPPCDSGGGCHRDCH